MAAKIDLNKIFLKRVHGDLLAVYTWLDDERALVLIPHLRGPKSPWFVVCESVAWRYDEPHYLAKRCAEAAQFMGMGTDKATWVRIASIVNEGIPDLVRMPSYPDWEVDRAKQAVGQLTVRADGEVVHQEDVVIPESEGVGYVAA